MNILKHRWNTCVNNLNFAFHQLNRLTKKLIRKNSGGRGRPTKFDPAEYVKIIILKELDKKSLRSAEVNLTGFVVGKRVDHSVIGYWENKPEIVNCLKIILARARIILDKVDYSSFTFVDATKFTTWNKKEIQIHIANRISKRTVYPIGASFLKKNVRDPVNECLPSGNKILYADAGYDDNKTIGVIFKKGYVPVVCPNKNRWRGHYRKRARKIYQQPIHRRGYRQRGRGESCFGSWTNEFGDRLKSVNEQSTQTRILARIVVYQIKLLLRFEDEIISVDVLIIRHAREREQFIKRTYLG